MEELRPQGRKREDTNLDIPLAIQKMDKNVLDIAHRKLAEVLKEAGTDSGESSQTAGSKAGPTSSPNLATMEQLVGRQLSAAETSQRVAKVSKQLLLETQLAILKKGFAMNNHTTCRKSKQRRRLGSQRQQLGVKNNRIADGEIVAAEVTPR